jgi:hypothetical protein
MAAEVGAELSGMEFSAMFGPAPAHTNMTHSMSFFLASYTDASGAPIPVDLTTVASDLAAALLRGPVYAQFDRMPTHFREHLKFIQPAFVVGFSRLGIDPFNERSEITLRGEGRFAASAGSGSAARLRASGFRDCMRLATRPRVSRSRGGLRWWRTELRVGAHYWADRRTRGGGACPGGRSAPRRWSVPGRARRIEGWPCFAPRRGGTGD